jgi:osmoprotectant transport system permease protein
MIRSRARQLGIRTISDLKAHPDLTLGFSNEFMDREDGWPGLRRHYGLPHEDVQGLDHDLAYRGLDQGDIDVIDLYSTDAEIEYYDIRRLEDDRAFFPSYRAVLLYRRDLRERAPEVVEALQRIEGRISSAEMTSMNKAVKIDDRSEKEVAASWVERTFDVEADIDRRTPWERFLQRSAEHLFMVVVSLSAAIALAVPLGIVAFRRRRLGQLVLGAVGIVQTIPSLAMLVFMIPLFGRIGTWPAIAALFLYSLLPIVRNTHAGLNDIPRDIRESAEVLGLPEGAILWRVELPIAMRAILAGVKTSSVINIGIATLGALIGAGGYGQPILTGIRLDDTSLILQGAVPAALLAVVAQGIFELAERWLVPDGLQLESQP